MYPACGTMMAFGHGALAGTVTAASRLSIVAPSSAGEAG
jgi:hypothetical protein